MRNFRRIRYGIIIEPRSSATTNWASEKYIRPVEADIIAMMGPSSIQRSNRRRIPGAKRNYRRSGAETVERCEHRGHPVEKVGTLPQREAWGHSP